MGQSAMKGHTRRNYFIDKDFQSGFILKFCALVAAGSVITIAMVYWLARQSTTVAFVKARVSVMTTADFIFPLLVQTVLIVALIVGLASILVTLFVSHKIAGPLFRFKQTFKELAQGNFTNQVRLRKDDQLVAVATDFNQMISTVRDQVHAANKALKAVKSEMDAIGEFNVEDAKRRHFHELKAKVQELEKAIHFFRT